MRRVLACLVLVGSGCFGRVLDTPSADDAGVPKHDASLPPAGDASQPPADANAPVDAAADSPLDAGDGTTMLATNQLNADFLALNDTDVFWTRTYPAIVAKVSKTGGNVTTLWNGGSAMIYTLAANASYVYWIDNGSLNQPGAVMRVPTSGGTAVALVSNQAHPFGIAIDATSIYWTNTTSNTIMRAGLDGTNPTVIATNQNYPRWIAVGGGTVCWTRGQTLASGDLVCSNLDGSNAIVVGSSTNTMELSHVQVGLARAYWIESGTAVESGALDGGGASVVTAAASAWGLAIDDANAYFSSVGLSRVPLDGGSPIVLAHPQYESVTGIALDATNVYFSTMDGNIRTMPK